MCSLGVLRKIAQANYTHKFKYTILMELGPRNAGGALLGPMHTLEKETGRLRSAACGVQYPTCWPHSLEEIEHASELRCLRIGK